jgi:diguanylate cyclase (GGDEF)-like protein
MAALALGVESLRDPLIGVCFTASTVLVSIAWRRTPALRVGLTRYLIGNVLCVGALVDFSLRYGNSIGGVDVGVGDVFLLLAYAMAVGSVLAFGRVNDRRFAHFVLIDALIAGMGGATLLWVTLFEPSAKTYDLTLHDRIGLLMYPTGDLVVFGVTLSLVTMARRRPASLYALLSFAAFSFVADLGLLTARLHHRGTDGLTSAAQILALASISVSTWHPSFRELLRLDLMPRRSSEARVALLTLATLAPGLSGLLGVLDAQLSLAASTALSLLFAARCISLLRESARSHARTLGTMSAGALDVVAIVLADATVVDVAPATARRLHLAPAGDRFTGACHPHDVAQLREALDAAMRSPTQRAEADLRLIVDGAARHFHLRVTDLRDDPDVAGLVLNAHDIDALHRLATVDVLTGLPNRAALRARLAASLAEARPLVVLLIDLDGFKEVNDTFGHAAGDAVLATAARRMEAVLGDRSDRWIGRLGGDEFVAVLTTPDPDEGARVADTIIDALREPVAVHGMSFALGASIGVRATRHGDVGEDALRDADIALYEAKRQGRGRAVRFEASMGDALRGKVEMRAELDEAIARGEFSLVYQPKVRCSDGALVGVEALARWARTDGTNIPPGRFIPIAEETGQIVPIGAWVLDHALAQLARWDDLLGPSCLRMAVNVSPRQLHDPGFVEHVADRLRQHGIAPSRLVVELTETAVMTDPERGARLLTRIRALGVHVSIDDYGAGNASISYLRQFPAEEVKIDRSLTDGLRTHDRAAEALIRSIIELARALRLTVVAEGVEDDEQLVTLRGLGCDVAQGYAIAPPLNVEKATRYVREHPPVRHSLPPIRNSAPPPRLSVH